MTWRGAPGIRWVEARVLLSPYDALYKRPAADASGVQVGELRVWLGVWQCPTQRAPVTASALLGQ